MNTVTFSRQTVSVFVHVVCKMTTRNSVCSLQVADERGESVAQYTNQSSNLSGSCASFHHRANLSRSCIVFHQLVKLSCLYTSFLSPTCEFTKLMHCFSPTCEVIMLIHSLCSPTCEFTRLMHCFSPTCEVIMLIHSFFSHQHANLLGSCIVFHQLVKLSCLYTLFFSPTCEFTRLLHCFSPTCEVIMLIHSLFHHMRIY